MKQFAPTPEEVWRRYQKSVEFKSRIGLYDTVKENENFFIGKQWEGVEANGLPTPVFNFLKRVTLFQVATVTSDNLAMQARAMTSTQKHSLDEIDRICGILNEQYKAIFERNGLTSLVREYMRNAAVDGDGCIYAYFDPEIENGQAVSGEIVTQIVQNTRVHFGNPNSRDVQSQPYVILSRRRVPEELRAQAEDGGMPDGEAAEIRPDNEDFASDMDNASSSRVTELLYMWRDHATKTIWMYDCTQNRELRRAWDSGQKLYPLVWLNWDYVQDCMHGQASITGLVPNQKFINRLFAMTMISLMTTAYPKIVYDKTRVHGWDSRVGAAIGINGGDANTVAKIINPTSVSPQIAQFIASTIDYTQKFLGASDVAMGDARPDNTSAILALQRAANTPMELTRHDLYRSLEELGAIFNDLMRVCYGTRTVKARPFLHSSKPFGIDLTGVELEQLFDFSLLGEIPVSLSVDVGASSYWSEIASMQTLDNLLLQGQIPIEEYLKRVPAGYIPKKQELIDVLTARKQPAGSPDAGTEQAETGGERSPASAEASVPQGAERKGGGTV